MRILLNRVGTARVITFRAHMMAKICAAAILCSGEGVLAQTIYKQMDAAGRTVFTDRPNTAGIVVLYETFPTQERGPVSSPRIVTGTRSDVAKALCTKSAMSSTYAATVDFNEATRRLTQARQSREDGIEPRPGEWTDGMGTTAMDKRYQRRQQRLEREVVAAERRSHETSLVRNAFLRRDGKTDPVKLALP